MSRVLGLPVLLVVLVVGGYLTMKSMQSSGPGSPTVTQAIAQANTSVAAANFQGADTAMGAFFAQNGTYAGAALPPGSGAVLVRSDATSYCLQATAANGTVEHDAGPGGQAQPGPC